MRIIGNLIWFIFGGVFVAIEYFIASFLLCITIIGIPFGIQTFKIGLLALWPFGKKVVDMEYSGGCISTILNVWWLICGGIWICLSHLLFGILFSITIVGLPFGEQHFKLAGLALTPFGKKVID